MKKGTSFELLVKAIYEEILLQDELENTVVEHDVKVIGKSGLAHQIDVYWEFIRAGVVHRVAVECKDYRGNVSIGKIRDFHSALNDIGNINGIFVTTSAYQSGAIKYANHHGIALKSVAEPSEKELSIINGVKTIVVNGNAHCIANVRMVPYLDADWVFANTDITEVNLFTIDCMTDELKVFDKNYNLLGTILDFENRLPRAPESTIGLSHKYDFDDAYLHVPNSGYPPLKLKALVYEYDTYTYTTKSVTHFKPIAQAILKDVLTEECHFFKKSVDVTNECG